LADWKRQLGYSVEVVSASSWTATDVKNAIQTRYSSWTPKPDYFVIIGDHDGSYAVPGEIHYTTDTPPEPFATDLYYACMDGGGDWHPDMAHGRISVSSSAEAQVVVDKIINYEKNPVNNSSFYQNGLNCAQYQDDDNNGYADRRFCHTSEDIRDYLQNNQGYTSERVYYTNSSASVSTLRYNNTYYSNGQLLPAELRNASFNWNGGASDITSAINAGKFYVFHRDHGYVGGSGWAHPYYTTSSMNSLSNGDLLPVVFSMNCHTGEFQQSNCFAEKFLRISGKGSVGVVAAAYYSYSGYNDGMSTGMIDAIWSNPGLYPVFGTAGTGTNYTIGPGNDIYTMGDVVNQGLYAMEQNVAWSSGRQYQYELFHWFGDPAMRIWTANPHNNIITASHSSTIDCAGSSFSISGSTPGALATLVYNNSLIGETTLDASGNGTITYTISSPGTQANLCISIHNNKPYTASLNVTGSCAFPPSVITDFASGVTGNSATANGQITNDFGSAVTESGFVYGTSPNPVIGGSNVTQLQTSPVVTMGSFSLNLSGLLSNTTYHYQAYAINTNGTSYGGDQSFTTLCGVMNVPYFELFNDASFPNCWTQQVSGGATDRWSVSASNNAGGSANEMRADYQNVSSGILRLISPPLNTTGMSRLEISFKHFFDDWGSGMSMKLQSSTDAISWTDESWSQNSGSGNIGPETVDTSINNNLNSSSTYVAFTLEGNLYQFDYWYVDDVLFSVDTNSSQLILLSSGWNILSFCVVPDSSNMLNLMQGLINSSNLVKVVDESGGFIQNIPGMGWMNTIGSMSNTEGYYTKVNIDDNLLCSGQAVPTPFSVPLQTGWNIMGYPVSTSQDAITVFNQLITPDSTLIKVIDEAGGFIQYIPGFGWMNTIDSLAPGEGYYIKLSANDTLTISDPSKAYTSTQKPKIPKPAYFPSYNSNPYNPMNFVITKIVGEGFEVEDGDEIAVYDGIIKVGSAVINPNYKGLQLITIRADDPLTENIDGFCEENNITFKYWDKSNNRVYDNILVYYSYGNSSFSNLGTFVGELKIFTTEIQEIEIPETTYLGQNYPNPFTNETIIEYGIANGGKILLSIYDISGRKLKTLINKHQTQGNYSVTFYRSTFKPGVYYYEIIVSNDGVIFSDVKKMVIK